MIGDRCFKTTKQLDPEAVRQSSVYVELLTQLRAEKRRCSELMDASEQWRSRADANSARVASLLAEVQLTDAAAKSELTAQVNAANKAAQAAVEEAVAVKAQLLATEVRLA